MDTSKILFWVVSSEASKSLKVIAIKLESANCGLCMVCFCTAYGLGMVLHLKDVEKKKQDEEEYLRETICDLQSIK